MAGRTPYLGPDTYGLEHRDLFFGRNAEGRVIASMVASERVSILTGPSGTGKSSLLRSQIVPTLATRCWLPIYAHAQDDPLKALRDELLAQALPDAAAERERIARLTEASNGKLDGDTLLSKAQTWFAALPRHDPRRTSLLESGDDKIPRHSLTALALAGVLTPAQALERLAMVAEYAPERPTPPEQDATLAELSGLLGAVEAGRGQLLRLLGLAGKPLTEAAGALWSGWAKPLGLLGIVLVLDQAEELYTAYGVPRSGAKLHDWTRRERLFRELANFAEAAETLPLRFCFSLRPEWYLRLVSSLGPTAPSDPRGTYVLARFQTKEAGEVIDEPPRAVGGQVTKSAKLHALRELGSESERQEIDPFLLAVTMDLAWREAAADGDPVKVELEHLRRIGTDPENPKVELPLIEGAMRRLLFQALEPLGIGDQYDALEILETLFNEDGSRRIVPENELLARPLRKSERLRGLVDTLEAAGLIRRFRRGVMMVEVRHERIAATVLGRLEAQHARDSESEDERGRYRSFLNRAIELLVSYDDARLEAYVDGGLVEDPLPAWAGAALRANRQDVEWDQAAARVMLASLLHNGPSVCEGASDETVHAWRAMVGEFAMLAGRRRQAEAGGAELSAREKKRFETELLRGTRIDPAAAAAWLAAGRRKFGSDVRTALLRCILSAPGGQTSDTGEIRKWIAQSFGAIPAGS